MVQSDTGAAATPRRAGAGRSGARGHFRPTTRLRRGPARRGQEGRTGERAGAEMKVVKLTTDHLRVPLGKPARVSLTDPKPAAPDAIDVVLVHLETDTG